MLELFTPQRVPGLTRRQPNLKVVEWRPGDALPWATLPPAAAGREWQHQVYLGVYELADIYETLRLLFAQDPEAHDLRAPGRSACAGLVIGQDGVLIGESVLLSSCAWALGQVNAGHHEKPGWSIGFEAAANGFSSEVVARDEIRQDGGQSEQPLPVDDDFLRWLLGIARATAIAGDIASLSSDLVVIRSVQVSSSTAADLRDFDFMNSLFLEDLRAVHTACADGQLGAALARYLTPTSLLDVSQRVDVVSVPAAVDSWTGAAVTPPGRWPSDPSHPLALSQQFAVNTALTHLGDGAGILAVNGPPGTGKTTLLRDLIAGNVVERARRLAQLRHPREAFTDETFSWRTGNRRCTVPQLKPAFTGFEMVIASANNAAVENVTFEIPAADAIDAPWSGQVNHFTELASNILRQSVQQTANESNETQVEGEARSAGEDAAWGLIAARLGNKGNRRSFVSSFWFGKGMPGPDRGLSHILTEWAAEPRDTWVEATQTYCKAHDRVDLLQQERVAAEQRIATREGVRSRLAQVASALESVATELDRAQGRVTYLSHRLAAALNECERADLARGKHLAVKPSVLETLFSLGAASRQWRAILLPLDDEMRQREHERAALEGDYRSAEDDLARTHAEQQDLLLRRASLDEECQRLDREIDRDALRFKESHPSALGVGDARELRAPWLDAEYNEARSDLFIAALALHRAFIRHLAAQMKPWMSAACDIVQGIAPRTLQPEAILAGWQVFALFVPVVSTTFASMGRMFRGLEPESLGWLLIDESGQCAPQQAVGAMWRAKRVLAVGDPMQLQPVVSMPPKAVFDMAASYGIADVWVPPRASVQTLADRVNLFGTTLENQDEPVWVSSPLRVHRRCDDPMFTISNQIAYDGLMISAVHRPSGTSDRYTAHPAVPETSEAPDLNVYEVPAGAYWADVASVPSSDSHLQPQEIERVRQAITYLHDRCGVPYEEIFAVSPFRAVAEELGRIADAHPGMRGGTVHTAQGREADVVLLVLGTSNARGGARDWAAASPNLLNVAVSRARRRLYVIGSYENWSKQKYFSTLAMQLPRR